MDLIELLKSQDPPVTVEVVKEVHALVIDARAHCGTQHMLAPSTRELEQIRKQYERWETLEDRLINEIIKPRRLYDRGIHE